MARYFFIINPTAGTENAFEAWSERLRTACEKLGVEYTYKLTEYPGHAITIAAEAAATATEADPLRIFSVGGDGTLHEIVSGITSSEGCKWCELGCIPCGTGNDYVKCYGDRSEFLDLDAYLSSEAIPVDCIRAGDLVSINICSLGLDAKICDLANRIKTKKKNLPGSKAYDRATFRCLLGKLYNDITVTIDGERTYSGKYLFSIAASGKCYGGGYYSAPMADPTDGKLDFILLKTVSHLRVPFLVGSYKNGSYVGKRKFKKLLIRDSGSTMRIQSKNPAIVNVDGECIAINDVTLTLMPAAMRFVVPKGYLEKRAAQQN